VAHRKKPLLDLWLVIILISNFFGLASGIVLGSFWLVSAISIVATVDIYWYYVRRIKGKKLQYPLVPPEGKGDVYLPRSNIPRPVHADFRASEERRRKFAKLNRLLRRKKRERR
jgi:hypothetical protein